MEMEIRYVQTDRQKQMGGEQTGQDYFQQIVILRSLRNIFTVFGGYSITFHYLSQTVFSTFANRYKTVMEFTDLLLFVNQV